MPSVQKGVADQYYFVNLFQPPLGGIITSDIGGINCGASAQTVSGTEYAYTYYNGAGSCGANGQTQIQWAQTVVLTAVPQGSNVFIGWAGDCSGVGTCTLNTLTNGADKTVVAIFGPADSGHGDFTNPAVHAAAAQSNTLACAKCHGASFEGVSIAPSCTKCHEFGINSAGVMASPESCQNCHATVPAHAITGKTTWTVVSAPADDPANAANLKFVVNVKVDGVNKAGLTAGRVYRYSYVPAREATTVAVPNDRIQLSTGTAAGNYTFTDNGAGNYTVTIIGAGSTAPSVPATATAPAYPLTGNHTFALRMSSGTGMTAVYATPVTHLNNPTRDLVSDQSCVNCHGSQVFRIREASGEWHHTANPYGVQACVVCHSVVGSTSRSMGGDRLTAYVHGVHNSHAMPARDISAALDADGRDLPGTATALFTVAKPDGVYARNDALVVNSTTLQAEISSPWSVGFPGYVINCSICHDTTARLNAIMAKPVSASTCFSCHDNWDGFPTFVNDPTSTTDKYDAKVTANPDWPTIVADHRAIALPLAVNPPTANACASCHKTGGTAFATVGAIHTTRITERNGVVYKGRDLSITEGDKVTMSIESVSYASTTLLSVTWKAQQLTGTPPTATWQDVNPCQNNTDLGPVFVGITSDQATANGNGLSASNMSILLSYAQGNDWVNAGVGTSPGQPPSAANAPDHPADAKRVHDLRGQRRHVAHRHPVCCGHRQRHEGCRRPPGQAADHVHGSGPAGLRQGDPAAVHVSRQGVRGRRRHCSGEPAPRHRQQRQVPRLPPGQPLPARRQPRGQR